jgi:hypothetical protein
MSYISTALNDTKVVNTVDDYIIRRGFYGHVDGLSENTSYVGCLDGGGVPIITVGGKVVTSKPYDGGNRYKECSLDLHDYSLKGLESLRV